MKIALCTTTIHVPHALKLLRKCSADVRFFVAIDEKTPAEIVTVVDGNTKLLTREIQGDWKCSNPIGWNTLARRNIAFLEALKWGADVVISWDDDNIPTGNLGHTDYFAQFAWALGHPFNGIQVTGTDHWFDPGRLLIPPTRHRGFPYDKPLSKTASPVTGAKVGVAAGLVLGDPDIDAVTRMEHRPDIGMVHVFGSTGVVVDHNTWTVFNSQNTAVIRELVPAWFMMPGVGRHDDIYASLIVQRVARERGLHVHLGPPFTYQQRNEHDLMKDLRAEIDGMERVAQMAAALDYVVLPGKSVVEDVRVIYDFLLASDFIPAAAHTAATAYLDDCEKVMGA